MGVAILIPSLCLPCRSAGSRPPTGGDRGWKEGGLLRNSCTRPLYAALTKHSRTVACLPTAYVPSDTKPGCLGPPAERYHHWLPRASSQPSDTFTGCLGPVPSDTNPGCLGLRAIPFLVASGRMLSDTNWLPPAAANRAIPLRVASVRAERYQIWLPRPASDTLTGCLGPERYLTGCLGNALTPHPVNGGSSRDTFSAS